MEQKINGKKVIFRDKFPARYGWGLLSAARRIDKRYTEELKALEEQGTTEDKAYIDWMQVVLDEVTYDEISLFIRGAVLSWEFDGDLESDNACDSLDPIAELMPLSVRAVDLFYKSNISGEAVGSSTPK